jgi:L-rhamnose mutarotase
MPRRAFRMSINEGAADEYASRHQPIWQELERVLFDHGVRTYSIFIDAATNDLFGYVEVESDEQWGRIAETDTCRRWWAYMRDLMPTNTDDSPVSRDLREVFHLGRHGREAAGQAAHVQEPVQ